jgi:hypothetical protein
VSFETDVTSGSLLDSPFTLLLLVELSLSLAALLLRSRRVSAGRHRKRS